MTYSKEDLSSKLRQQRTRLYDWLFSCLIGPGPKVFIESEDYDLKGIKPLDRYHLGILFPIERGIAGVDPATESDKEEENGNFDPLDQDDKESKAVPVNKKFRYVPPSSAGFSFFINGQDINLRLEPWAVKYSHRSKDRDRGRFQEEIWQRKPCVLNFSEPLANICSPKKRSIVDQRFPVFDDISEVSILWRPYADGWLVTVSISNRQELPAEASVEEFLNARNALSLFEVHLECIIESGEVGSYPSVDPNLLDAEDQELELQYKHKHIYAVGHGTAADWDEAGGHVKKIKIDFLPRVEVPQVSVDAEGHFTDVLSLEFLSRLPENARNICDDLYRFVSAYEEWVRQQIASVCALSKYEQGVASRITARMEEAVSRMKTGVQLILKDANVTRSFGLANKAMYLQMKQYDRVQRKADRTYRWRPFQLAFLLMVIESVINEDSAFRDTLDLIWFPTGGGKTEAYLGLIAFLIVLRRLRYPASGGGTTIIMRYSLRLLTQQQFQRACRLICAMELLRGERSDLGKETISVGIWVGEGMSPNRCDKAAAIVANAIEGNETDLQKLVLDSCPWCQKTFKPPDNYIFSEKQFQFRCTNPDCDFGQLSRAKEGLPCNVVDDVLYETPPTLLIATIDKFARLTWEEQTTAFFGRNANRPPELVIQDELHLISGALGSIAGLYEAALDTILCHSGVFPKYIASTATIRMAKQQVQRLYGRPVAVFPPPGLSSDDSYYARTVPIEEKPGRLYVGCLAHNQPRHRSMAPIAASLLASPHQLFSDQADAERLLDAWWTIVVYHSSLKSVSNSDNILKFEVLDYLARYTLEEENRQRRKPDDEVNMSNKKDLAKNRLEQNTDGVAHLTSLSSAEENASTFKRLEKLYSDPQSLDVVLATNMISVGLDVSRLALMVINGQPLTTAEYIQASSRVGRGDIPGLVIVNFFRDQARSLSHYESFRAYHESFYRFVEPSSITPYTYQARTRALHAALVIAIRHCCPNLLNDNMAGNFKPDSQEVRKVLELLNRRLRKAAIEGASDIEDHLQMLVDQWHTEVIRCQKNRQQLDYQATLNNHATERLLYNHDDRIKGIWATLQSMRNVEKTTLLKII